MSNKLRSSGGLDVVRSSRFATAAGGLGLAAVLMSGCSSGQSSPDQKPTSSSPQATVNPNTPAATHSAEPSKTVDPIDAVLNNYDPSAKFPYSYSAAKEVLRTSGIGDFSAVTKAIDSGNPAYFTKQKVSSALLEKNLSMFEQLIDATTKLKSADPTTQRILSETVVTYQAMRLTIKEILTKQSIAPHLAQEAIVLSGSEYKAQGQTDTFMYTLARPTHSQEVWGLFKTDSPTDDIILGVVQSQPSSSSAELTKAISYATFLTSSCAAELSGYSAGCDLSYYTSRS